MSHPVASCLIISTNEVVEPWPVYPLGAACVAGALRVRGHRVRHVDLLADGREALREVLEGEAFTVIGISIRNLTTIDSGDPDDYVRPQKELAQLVRRLQPEAALVLGGAGFAIFPEEVMALFGADYGITGEGEELFPWLVEELAAGRRPLQRLFAAPPLEGAPPGPDFSESTTEYYLRRGGMLNLQTRRGCSHNCAYCTYPQIEGRRVRRRDADQVGREALRLERELGARHLFFADSVFNDVQGHHLAVAEALLRHGVSIPWSAYFRPQGLTAEGLALLKRAGLHTIELGTDAASDATLAGLNKGFTFAEVEESHRLVVEAGIPLAHFVIFGGPGESAATLQEGVENLRRLEGAVVFAFAGIRILPGTAIHRRALAEGVVEEGASLLEPHWYFSPQSSLEQVDEVLRSAFADRRQWIYPCTGFNLQTSMLHSMGQSGPLWDLLLK